jgi:hypothetical protein
MTNHGKNAQPVCSKNVMGLQLLEKKCCQTPRIFLFSLQLHHAMSRQTGIVVKARDAEIEKH